MKGSPASRLASGLQVLPLVLPLLPLVRCCRWSVAAAGPLLVLVRLVRLVLLVLLVLPLVHLVRWFVGPAVGASGPLVRLVLLLVLVLVCI